MSGRESGLSVVYGRRPSEGLFLFSTFHSQFSILLGRQPAEGARAARVADLRRRRLRPAQLML
ncbi:MAG TPA: hypothetical protein DEH06_05435 [Alistipes sp.]|nr:hypothetical protein [Alistipes sp.]